MKRLVTLRVIAATLLTLGLASQVWANGEEFFLPPEGTGPVTLGYVGRIKDSSTNRPLRTAAFLTIMDKETGENFAFIGDKPGHFRSPDIGAALKALGVEISPKRLSIEVVADGYKTLTYESFPRKDKGLVELNLTLEPLDAAAAGTSVGGGDGGLSLNAVWMILIGGLLVTVIAGKGARTLGLRQSTAR